MALYLCDRAADVERRAPAAYGSLPRLSCHGDDGVADDRDQTDADYGPEYRRHAQRAVAAVPDDAPACQRNDYGDVRFSRRAQAHHRERRTLSQCNGVFRHWYGAGGYRRPMAPGQ
ncbi:hypothetical protein D3C76_907200 [compost metagenome]